LPPLLVVFTLLLDTTILPIFTNHWLIPLLALLTVHTLGLLLGRTQGSLYGMISGLLVDISLGTPLGLMTLFYGGLGYLGGWFGRAMLNHPLAPVIASALCFTVFEFGMALYTIVAGAAFSSQLILHALIRVPLDIALTEGLYILYDWLIKPSRSRFAPR
jgi:rod shape-determining protein MreD